MRFPRFVRDHEVVSARGHADVAIIDSVPNDPRDPAQQRLAAPRSNASSACAADPQIHAADRMESETPGDPLAA